MLLLSFAQIGIVNGYSDWNFGPQNTITRAEFLKIALTSHCYSYDDQDGSLLEYDDIVADSWQARVVSKAKSLSMIDGNIDAQWNKVFRPNDAITKIEALKILMRLSSIQVDNPVELGYDDIFIEWQKRYVQIWETIWLLNARSDDNKFNPDIAITRESVINLVNKLVPTV